MSMTINTNVMSLNAQRNTIQNSASMATTLQRLSSGLRVNSAKDDAAGLAIATRMDTQVRGMNVAIRNANDGISLAQTAEAGMNTITEMLQRMRELAVQAANSTNTTGLGGDIDKLNDEYKQLAQEIGRTLGSVSFNSQPLLSGGVTNYSFQIGANSGTTQQIVISGGDLNLVGGSNSGAIGQIFQAGGTTGAWATLDLAVNSGSSNAVGALSAIDSAISAVNTARAKLGAVQSRFENTISFLRNAVEQQAAARGRIMDADFAAETANLSRQQILQQAGTAMIAQANQVPQNVLSLLRG
ncbi:MAG TPA: flagellin [Burkholderiaceae bacterium]|nr:flagellin [Burkholderiaceae bacterium]